MNKMNLRKISLAVITAISFSACSNEELAEGLLPEGKYPLEIASVTMKAEVSEQPWTANAPKTRVAENSEGNSSVWEIGDEFYVKFEGSDKVGTYRIVDATGRVEAVTPVYWPSASRGQTIIAWYAPSENGMMDISDQTNGLHYVIRAKQNAEYNSNAPVSLEFKHQLAKVRVQLSASADHPVEVNSVKIKSYTSVNFNKGIINTDGASEGWIEMKQAIYNGGTYWEANVVPGHPITRFQVNGHEDTLSGDGITPVARAVNTITINLTTIEFIARNSHNDPH